MFWNGHYSWVSKVKRHQVFYCTLGLEVLLAALKLRESLYWKGVSWEYLEETRGPKKSLLSCFKMKTMSEIHSEQRVSTSSRCHFQPLNLTECSPCCLEQGWILTCYLVLEFKHLFPVPTHGEPLIFLKGKWQSHLKMFFLHYYSTPATHNVLQTLTCTSSFEATNPPWVQQDYPYMYTSEITEVFARSGPFRCRIRKR